MRRFAIGDIHGAHKALIQCFERSGIDREEDMLICLGDVADGWPEVPECFDELLTVNNLIYIMGNHDEWLRSWFKFVEAPHIWLSQGGQSTLDSYMKLLEWGDTRTQIRHENLLDRAVFYHVLDNKLFVHGGYDWHNPIEHTLTHELMWNRSMWKAALYWKLQGDRGFHMDKVKDYDEVFIGHTTTSQFDPELKPVNLSNVWNLDQGCGFEGKLTLMDIDSKEYWQSDIVSSLYPDVAGKR